MLINLISLLGVVIYFYFALISDQTNLKVSAKENLKHVVFNVILILIIYFAIGHYVEFISIFTEPNFLDTLYLYMDQILEHLFKILYEFASIKAWYNAAQTISMGSGYTVPIPYTPIGINANAGASPFTYTYLMNSWIELGITGIEKLIDLFVLLKFMTPFFLFISASLFLPLGLFFRSFKFTNRIGSTMTSIGIVLYFVYPVVLYFIIHFTGGFIISLSQNIEGLLMPLVNNASTSFMEWNTAFTVLRGVAEFIKYARWTETLLRHLFLIRIIGEIIAVLYRAAAMGSWAVVGIGLFASTGMIGEVQTLIHVADSMASLYIVTIFINAVLVLIILGSIRSLSLLLGGEYFLYGIQTYI